MSGLDGDAYSFGREDWIVDGLCAQLYAEDFFPAKGGSTKAAKQGCKGCPVTVQCLEFAMRNEPDDTNRYGVYGGMSPRERSRLARSGWRPGDPIPSKKEDAA
jgi:WhiB family redox-sensing transcriptional regulator